VTGAIVNVDEYKTHENQDGSVDRTRTDLYLHLVNREDNSILEVSQVLELVDRNIEKLDALFKDFNVLDTQPAQPQSLAQLEQAGTTLWLATLTLFLTGLLVICVGLCLSQRASYQRQLKAANATPFGELRRGFWLLLLVRSFAPFTLLNVIKINFQSGPGCDERYSIRSRIFITLLRNQF
jgi:cadherin 23